MQITKLSFLSTQAVGNSVFAIEEVIDVPIDQIFGSYRSREKALFNFIQSDAVEKVSRDTWKIVKDITLEASNALMRQGDFFRVKLDEEGDDSPVHFDLDATGVFVLSRDVFASLQTYTVLEPGVEQSIRMQFTFGGKPVVDAVLTSKFSSMKLEPVDATNGIYELKYFTAMAPSDDIINIEVTGVTLRNSVYEAPVRVTVRAPALSVVPIDTTIYPKQTKKISWQLMMEGRPAARSTPVSAQPASLITKVGTFRLTDAARSVYELELTADEDTGVTTVDTTYSFSYNYTDSVVVDLNVLAAPPVFITPDQIVLDANKTQVIPFKVTTGYTNPAPVTNAKYSTTDIRGPGVFSVEKNLVVLDAAAGYYGYRVTTNHRGGPVAIRSIITIDGTPYPIFFDLTARSTPVIATPLNTLPAAETSDLTFRVQQARLGGMTNLVGVIARSFTVTGAPVARVNGSVVEVGQGVYKISVTTNDRGGQVHVSAVLTVDGEDFPVTFNTSADILGQVTVEANGTSLVGEKTQPMPLKVMLEGVLYDMVNPTVTISGDALVSYGSVRRTGAGTLEVQDVNVDGDGGILLVSLTGLVKGYSRTVTTTYPVTSISPVVAENITHVRPTTTVPVQFNVLRDGVVPSGITFGTATVSGPGMEAFDGTIEIIDVNTGRYQVKSVTGSAPTTQQNFQVSVPIQVNGYDYVLRFNSYTEAMPTLDISWSGNVAGGKVQNFPLKIEVDGVLATVQDSNVIFSGTPFVSVAGNKLLEVEPGVYEIQELEATEDPGDIHMTGTLLIDGITFQVDEMLHVDAVAPVVSNVNVLEAETVQVLTFQLTQKGVPVGDAVLENGVITGAAVSTHGGFSLSNSATGTYRADIITNADGGLLTVSVDVTINGTRYPVTFPVTVKAGQPWNMVVSDVVAATDQSVTVSFYRGGLLYKAPQIRNPDVIGTSVLSASPSLTMVGQDGSLYRWNSVKLDSQGGDVTFVVEVSSNDGHTWHTLSETKTLAQAAAPTVTPGAMLVARRTDVLKFTIKRGNVPISGVVSNIQVSGVPIESAAHDVIVVSSTQGIYGTTVTTNDLGGPINVTFDLKEGGVDYLGMTFVGAADIYHPWKATLVNGPVPETATNVDILSKRDDGSTMPMINPMAEVTGSCVVSPVGSVPMIYQDASTGRYRIPNVMVNNNGGPINIHIEGEVDGAPAFEDFAFTVVPLPALTVTPTGGDLAFQTATKIKFDVARGSNPSIFTSNDAKAVQVVGPAVASFTPKVTPVGAGSYEIDVVTNGQGGNVSVSFTVTLAGIDYQLGFNVTAKVEPPVTAVSTNTLATNATATNLDFQLLRGTLPCADAFVVQSVSIVGRSVTSYPQSVINVDVSQGKYRMQVNTSAYSTPADVTIVGTVRGEPVTLTFQVQIVAGVLPTVTLVSSDYVHNLQSTGTLAFRQGSTVISGITLDSVDGPLENATLVGNDLSGIPTNLGVMTLTINFVWRGAVYSSQISAPVNEAYPFTLADSELPALKVNTLAFSLLDSTGNPYPATGYTYKVTAPGLTVSPGLVRQQDGTYTMGVRSNVDLPDTRIMIDVTETATGIVRKHTTVVTVWYNIEARYSGGILDSSQVSNSVQFDTYESTSGGTFTINNGTDLGSLNVVDKNGNGDITGFASFRTPSAPTFRGMFTVSTNHVDIVDGRYSFDYSSSVRKYKIFGEFRVQSLLNVTWLTTTGFVGGVQSQVQFQIKSGAAPITDAAASGTTVSNATLIRDVYAVDASQGIYAIDVNPLGTATSFAITLRFNQLITGLVSTMPVRNMVSTPGAITAVAVTTLQRTGSAAENLDIRITQGGVVINNATINSYSLTGNSLVTPTGPTFAGNGIYRWSSVIKFTGADLPHLTINATINGVGHIFNIDYPIVPEKTLTMSISSSPNWARYVQGALVFIIEVDGVRISMSTYPSGPVGAPKITSDNATFVSTSRVGTSPIRASLELIPRYAGAGQKFLMDIPIYGVDYPFSVDADVLDGGKINITSNPTLVAVKPNSVVFTIDPPEGVTMGPTDPVTLNVSGFPITAQPTVVNGVYTAVLTPGSESVIKYAISGTATSGGNTFSVGSDIVLDAAYDLYLSPRGLPNENTGTSKSWNVMVAYRNAAGVGTDLNWSINSEATFPTSELRAVSDPTGFVNGTPTNSFGGLSYVRSLGVPTIMGDRYRLSFIGKVVSPAGRVYENVTSTLMLHDTAALTWKTVGPLVQGTTLDLEFYLKYSVSGNPVQHATYTGAFTITGGTAANNLKVIDASQGLYAITVTVGTAATLTITPRYGWVDSYSNAFDTGVAKSFDTLLAAKSMYPVPYQITRMIPIFLKDKDGPVNGVITGISAGGYVDAVTGPISPYDGAKGLYMVPMISINRSASPAIWPETVNLTYEKDGNTVTVPIVVSVAHNPSKFSVDAMDNTLTPVSLTAVSPITGTVPGFQVMDREGNILTAGNGSTIKDNATGKYIWTPTTATPAGLDRVLDRVNGFNYYFTDSFEVVRNPSLTVSPTWWPYRANHNGSSIAEQDLADFPLTIVDDLGVGALGAAFEESTLPKTFTDLFGPRLATPNDWSTTIVPVTDGSDGKYLMKLRIKPQGWWWTGQTRTTVNFTSTSFPGLTFPTAVILQVN